MSLAWNSAGRPENEAWVICKYANDADEVCYDAGQYFEENDVLAVDFEEACFTTPFGDYFEWARIEE